MIHKKWIVITPTLCQGDIPAYWDDETPVLFDSKVEAYKEIADSKIIELQQFLDDERSLDETDFSFEDFVLECNHDDETGIINSLEQLVLFNPETFEH